MTTFKPGETYKTRDGREARVYATDGGGKYPVHGAIYRLNEWALESWNELGQYDATIPECDADLMPPKRELWVNVYEPNMGGAWPNKETANAMAMQYSKRIARIRVEYTEGQFDD